MLRGFAAQLAAKSGAVCRRGRSMRDWAADWKKWSRSERLLAVIVTGLMFGLPIGLLLAGKVGI
jgi:hypothetical protein